MSLLLAVDGGNSKTEAVVFTEAGRVVAELRGEGSGGGPEHVCSVLASLLDESLRSGIAGAALALAGVDFPDDEEAFTAAVSALLPAARVVVENDAAALLDLREHPDASVVAVVVSGAGLNAVARGPMGLATVPAIGWPSGDFGGGDEVARRAIAAAYRSADGRGPSTALERVVLDVTGAPDHRSLARLIRRDLLPGEVFASLSSVVARCAEEGDPVAAQLIAEAADEAVGLLCTVVAEAAGRRRGEVIDGRVEVEVAGGMFRDEGFRSRVESAVVSQGWIVEHAHGRPVTGAVRLACREHLADPREAEELAERVLGALDSARTERTATE
ncbi:BadF/BadG/BcrA/BcrD ATPase family protein [Gryllotalpicola koreensis]|uniref:N-acetylglucosamine kinase n=1 Tax=Gryllotalpicola koreensis TaxID=993086 RepID=A0ABP8A569_9MICO